VYCCNELIAYLLLITLVDSSFEHAFLPHLSRAGFRKPSSYIIFVVDED
jgi:hypothetical protein